MPYIYVLECRGGSFYTGITTDLKKRMRQHCGQLAGGAKYTHSHPPEKLCCIWETTEYTAAKRFEAAFKRLTRLQKQALIAEPTSWKQYLPQLTEDEFAPISVQPLENFLDKTQENLART